MFVFLEKHFTFKGKNYNQLKFFFYQIGALALSNFAAYKRQFAHHMGYSIMLSQNNQNLDPTSQFVRTFLILVYSLSPADVHNFNHPPSTPTLYKNSKSSDFAVNQLW